MGEMISVMALMCVCLTRERVKRYGKCLTRSNRGSTVSHAI